MSDNNNTKNLLSPVRVGAYELPNRMVMAPLTRSRAGAGLAPTEMNATYYAQRASAGLIVTEATHITTQGIGYPHTPASGRPSRSRVGAR
jgi:N-ethylmaleimide reductase